MSDKFSVAVDTYLKIDGQLTDIRGKLRLGLDSKGNRCPYNPELVSKALQNIIEGRFNHTVENKILRLLSTEEHLTINAMMVTAIPHVVVLKPVDIDVQAVVVHVHVSNEEMYRVSSLALPFHYC